MIEAHVVVDGGALKAIRLEQGLSTRQLCLAAVVANGCERDNVAFSALFVRVGRNG